MVIAGKLKLLARQGEGLSDIGVTVSDPAQFVRVVGGGMLAGGDDDLVADETGWLVDGVRIEPAEAEVGAPPDDEEGGTLAQTIEAGEVDISTVHDIEGAGFGGEFVEHPGVVPPGAGDMDESRDVAAQIQQRVQLDGGLALLERRPREDREAEIDGGGVEGVDGLVEIDAERLAGIQAPGNTDQGLGEVGVNAPVAPFVGIGQGGARDISADAHVVKLARLGAPADFDVAQALAIGQALANAMHRN